MPENIDARIIIAVESSAARQGIDNVKSGLNGITDARERDLRIAQAKSRMEVAEYQSSIAAQKAYNAELQLETAEKLKQIRIKRGADADEIKKRTERIQQFRGEVLKLQQAEASANFQAYQSKVAYENLLNPVDKATDGTKKLTAAQIAARAAGRALGIDLSGTSANMIKLGIVAAGAAAAVKLVKFAYDQSRESVAEYIRLQDENAKSVEETEKRFRKQLDTRSEDLRILSEYGGRQKLTASQTYALSTAIERLGKNFRGLKLEIKDSGDRLKDFGLIAAENEAKINKERIASLRREVAAISTAITEREKAMAGNPRKVDIYGASSNPWRKMEKIGERIHTDFVSKIEKDRLQKEINEAKEKQLALNREIGELMSKDPVGDYRKNMIKAITEVTNRDIDRRLANLAEEREIQTLIISGSEREAEIRRIRNKLDAEALRLQGKELEIFTSRRAEIEKSMLESYDQKAAEKAEKAEKDKLEAAEKAKQKRLKQLEKERLERLAIIEKGSRTEAAAIRSISDRIFAYRQTVQDAITSRSAEGIALQSRVFMNTRVSMTDNPAKQTAAGVKEIIRSQNRLNTNLQRIVNAIDSGLKINLKAHKY